MTVLARYLSSALVLAFLTTSLLAMPALAVAPQPVAVPGASFAVDVEPGAAQDVRIAKDDDDKDKDKKDKDEKDKEKEKEKEKEKKKCPTKPCPKEDDD